jgi:hypothetical protein
LQRFKVGFEQTGKKQTSELKGRSMNMIKYEEKKEKD